MHLKDLRKEKLVIRLDKRCEGEGGIHSLSGYQSRLGAGHLYWEGTGRRFCIGWLWGEGVECRVTELVFCLHVYFLMCWIRRYLRQVDCQKGLNISWESSEHLPGNYNLEDHCEGWSPGRNREGAWSQSPNTHRCYFLDHFAHWAFGPFCYPPRFFVRDSVNSRRKKSGELPKERHWLRVLREYIGVCP